MMEIVKDKTKINEFVIENIQTDHNVNHLE
jgi:hypothetical protein